MRGEEDEVVDEALLRRGDAGELGRLPRRPCLAVQILSIGRPEVSLSKADASTAREARQKIVNRPSSGAARP